MQGRAPSPRQRLWEELSRSPSSASEAVSSALPCSTQLVLADSILCSLTHSRGLELPQGTPAMLSEAKRRLVADLPRACGHCRDQGKAVDEQVAAALKGNEALFSRKVSRTTARRRLSSAVLTAHILARLVCNLAGSYPTSCPCVCIQELALIKQLLERGQGHLFAAWPPLGTQVRTPDLRHTPTHTRAYTYTHVRGRAQARLHSSKQGVFTGNPNS